MKKHIVIIGSGFGGMEVARRLSPYVRAGSIDVTVINRTNAFLFTPLLHEVATGGLSPTSVTEPLREVFVGTGIRVVQGDVTSINTTTKTITVGTCAVTYDVAVLATGAETNYYNTPGAEACAVPLKTLGDALRIREQVIDAFERAAVLQDTEARKRLLSFVVVGAGATGVELVAELAEFTNGIACRYFRDGKNGINPTEVTVTLVSAGAEVLTQFSSATRVAADAQLQRDGVVIRRGTHVQAVDAGGVLLADGTRIDAVLVAWTAGVRPVVPPFVGCIPTTDKGRVVVDATLRVPGCEDLFALGDAAVIAQSSAQLPMLAQVAVAQGKVVARNVLATVRQQPLVPFAYRSKGSLVSLGQWFAAGTVGPLHLSGRFTWWLWRTVYLFKFASTKKRVRIAFEWTLNLFSPRDITKLTQ